MNNVNSLKFMGMDTSFDEADIVLFGAGYDGTVSYKPGCRFAPQEMRTNFYGLESYSMVLDRDIEECKLHDCGDLSLPFGNVENALDIIYKHVKYLLGNGKRPFMLGGEHLVTLAAIKAIHEKHENLAIVHLDAHTDLRDDYVGLKLSHATVMRRCYDLLGDGSIYQFGVRSGTKEELLWAKEHIYLHKFNLDTLAQTCEALSNRPVYISVDLDVLDPSVLPGTGAPEPGGISFREIETLFLCMKYLNVVGADIVELCPLYDASGVSVITACKVLREMILSM